MRDRDAAWNDGGAMLARCEGPTILGQQKARPTRVSLWSSDAPSYLPRGLPLPPSLSLSLTWTSRWPWRLLHAAPRTKWHAYIP